MRLPGLGILLHLPLMATAFQAPNAFGIPNQHKFTKTTTKLLYLLPPNELFPLQDITTATPPSSSSLLLAEESWRQYVPLGVSVLVILDILLGSPAANSLLSLTRPPEETEEGTGEAARGPVMTQGERIDSADLANEALEKARNALEWQTYKEETKTDEDRMEDMRKKMDKQLREFDDNK